MFCEDWYAAPLSSSPPSDAVLESESKGVHSCDVDGLSIFDIHSVTLLIAFPLVEHDKSSRSTNRWMYESMSAWSSISWQVEGSDSTAWCLICLLNRSSDLRTCKRDWMARSGSDIVMRVNELSIWLARWSGQVTSYVRSELVCRFKLRLMQSLLFLHAVSPIISNDHYQQQLSLNTLPLNIK